MSQGASFAKGMERGFGYGFQSYRDDLHQKALKKRFEADEQEREMRRRLLKLQEERELRAEDARQQRGFADQIRREDDLAVAAAERKARNDPNHPDYQMEQARLREAKARADITARAAETPAGPKIIADEYDENVLGWGRRIAAATEDLVQAQQSGDAGAVQFAQTRLQKLQQGAARWDENALTKPTKEPEVEIKFTAPGGGDIATKVPQSQWNPQHPLWDQVMVRQFGNAGANADGANPKPGFISRLFGGSGGDSANDGSDAGDSIPTFTPEQARDAAPGTKFRTNDGRILIR